jgi:CheY-like chemotaxis protein
MSKKILLADDEEPVRALVAATLMADGRYLLLEAENGEQALEIARTEKPDLIFLDILMPLMDGLEVCRRLKTDPETRGLTIIMLTALAQEADMERGREAGADGYFTKPFSPTALLQKAEEVLG